MAAPNFVGASPQLSLPELEMLLRQQEELLGPLVAIGTDQAQTILTFDLDQDPPAAPVILRLSSEGVPDNLAGSRARVISTGTCFVRGQTQNVTAYRPS